MRHTTNVQLGGQMIFTIIFFYICQVLAWKEYEL